MAKQVVVNPEARLEQHPSDVLVPDKQLLNLSLFAKLKQKPSLEKFPGTWIVRHYVKGEVIFRQGEAGWTAFYPLTTEDILSLRLEFQKTIMDIDLKQEVSEELTMLTTRFAQLQVVQQIGEGRTRAPASLRCTWPLHAKNRRNQGAVEGCRVCSARCPRQQRPQYIPIDGPLATSITRRCSAPIYEGEPFGEMSACTGRPLRHGRRARDCYMLEVMRISSMPVRKILPTRP